MRIGLDVMGGDKAPDATLGGAILSIPYLHNEDVIVLFGDETVITDYLRSHNADMTRFEIVNCSQVIDMSEHPTRALGQKPDSTTVVGFQYLKDKQIDAFASAGNSGAMLVGAVQSVGLIDNVLRPCASVVIPQENGSFTMLLDVGTTPDSKPENLLQFAIIGSTFMKHLYNIDNPIVKLLNIGSENEKGSILYQNSYKLLKQSEDINFCGNIESRDVLRDKADVIVCDGFTGNIVLKLIESFYYLLSKRDKLDDFFSKLNYEKFGGTPILGVKGNVMIGHGISSEDAICNMIINCKRIHQSNYIEKPKLILNNFKPIN
ncbi:MAG: phosphate--acyl-ACP acyltransferase [Bacteroidales bacterium]